MSKDRPQCGLILENTKGEILLQLRDNKSAIPYPNTWGTFGGQIEKGETPKEAIIREIKEELGYTLLDPEYLGVFPFDGYDIHMFRKVDNQIKLRNLKVKEGQCGEFFSVGKLEGLRFAFNCESIVREYIKRFSNNN
ncbi:MAG: NUDIX domain-containing protein [Candidatus Paceibacterota bacterium]|jgi:8-oxo-dGTP diphosphatase